MKIETLLNAFAYTKNDLSLGFHGYIDMNIEKAKRRSRQYRTFRARILREFAILRNFAEANGFDRSQTWFWTDEWQAKEKEAEEDVAIGRVYSFESMEEFLDSLDELNAE